jgi:hypothetical protein
MKKGYRNEMTILSVLKEAGKERPVLTGELWDRLHSRNPELKFESFRQELRELTSRGLIEISEPPVNTFLGYLGSWRFGFRLWLFAGGVISALTIVESVQSSFPLILVRWVAGTIIVVFVPGYAFTWALFPSRQQLSSLNRFALTIAMSLFFVPVVGLLLNYTSFGVQPTLIAGILTVFSLGMAFFGANREFQILRRRPSL